MKKLTRKKATIISAICFVVITGAIIITLQIGNQASDSTSVDWRKLRASFMEIRNGAGAQNYFVRSKNIALTESEITSVMMIAELQDLGGHTKIDTMKELIRLKALYQYAATIGIEFTEKEIAEARSETLASYRTQMRNTPNFHPDYRHLAPDNAEGQEALRAMRADHLDNFLDFIECTGLTENEFWEFLLHDDTVKIRLAFDKLTQHFIDNFDGMDSFEDMMTMTAEELNRFNKEYSAWLENIQTQILADEGIDLDEVRGRLR